MKIRPLMLTPTFAKNVKAPGRYGDGRGGLGLLVRPASRGGFTKSWTQSVRIGGKPTSLGLGRYPVVTLAMARERALENARAIADGRDPRGGTPRGVPTFAQALETVIAIHAENWKDRSSSEHQWRATLTTYAFPRIGSKRVDEVTTADVMAILTPIWSSKHVTAKRIRQRIGAVMKWAVAQGHRADNPAGDALGAALPKNGAAPRHQRALPHAEVGPALGRIRHADARPTGARCRTRNPKRIGSGPTPSPTPRGDISPLFTRRRRRACDPLVIARPRPSTLKPSKAVERM